MSKYRQMFLTMMEENKEVFDNFMDIHREYTLDQTKWQKLFNQYGGEVMDIVRNYERKLLGHMESGKYGKFSTAVSDKFMNEVRKVFPKIDFVGVVVST